MATYMPYITAYSLFLLRFNANLKSNYAWSGTFSASRLMNKAFKMLAKLPGLKQLSVHPRIVLAQL